MTMVQRLFKAILPAAKAAGMEAESRSWIARCDDCGRAASIWEHGGVRWKAAGTPRVRLRCAGCGAATWHTVTRQRPQG